MLWGLLCIKKVQIILKYEVIFKGKAYTAYEVGRGKEGLYLTVFDDKKQVALIEKEIKVKDYKEKHVKRHRIRL